MHSGFDRPFTRLSDKIGGGKVGLPVLWRQTTPGAFSWTAPADGVVRVAGTGGGASGRFIVGSGTAPAGGGAATTRATIRVKKGDVISGTVAAGAPARTSRTTTTAGANGGSTIINLPDGRQMVAGGGQVSAGGTATGGDINSSGGAGGSSAVARDGSPGTNGGMGGLSTGTSDTGGGGAGGDPEFNLHRPGDGMTRASLVYPSGAINIGGGTYGLTAGSTSGTDLPAAGNGAVTILFVGLEE